MEVSVASPKKSISLRKQNAWEETIEQIFPPYYVMKSPPEKSEQLMQ